MVTYENMMLAMRVYSCLIDTLADSRATAAQPSHSPNQSAGTAPAGGNAPAAEAPQEEVELRLQGSGIMFTIIDDYAGR
jgi:hypothetical protein